MDELTESIRNLNLNKVKILITETDIVAMNSISSLKLRFLQFIKFYFLKKPIKHCQTVYSSSSLKNNFCLFEDKLFKDN
ncbi:hypothetical protein BpHYR1_021123 [Brachionus plicatilis]|uniref:Uncharacterized protein n=1 Tax=Brachionus plicatilis TaxID=10195 RepID=A0A3M7PHV0_BRAPC|nr:hypothetical protein BpHYR1_021123 [Brachionus plicatilis]